MRSQAAQRVPVMSSTDRRSSWTIQQRCNGPSLLCRSAQVLLGLERQRWMAGQRRHITRMADIHLQCPCGEPASRGHSCLCCRHCCCRRQPLFDLASACLPVGPVQPWSRPKWWRRRRARTWASSSSGLASCASRPPAPSRTPDRPAAWQLHLLQALCSSAMLQARAGPSAEWDMPWLPNAERTCAMGHTGATCPCLFASCRCRLLFDAIKGIPSPFLPCRGVCLPHRRPAASPSEGQQRRVSCLSGAPC